jgi:hypothetical protein
MSIISISGFIGAGKDTVADYLVNEHGFKRESFANTLKDAVSAVFGWPRELLEGLTDSSRAWREQKDEWWSERLGMDITPRWILQYWGTNVLRQNFHDDIWIASLERKLMSYTGDIVITDCRFPNEVKALRNVGAKFVMVERGVPPAWLNVAKLANRGDTKAQQWLLDEGIHPSESSWVNTDFDVILNNRSDLNELYSNIRSQVLALPLSKVNDSELFLADN